MTAMLMSRKFAQSFGTLIEDRASRIGFDYDIAYLPEEENARLPSAVSDRVEIGYVTRDLRRTPGAYDKFCEEISAAKNLKWVHFGSAGIDQHPFVPAIMQRGVIITTSSGSNSEPVAQFAITGLLMLARRFPVWIDAQRRHSWEHARGVNDPPPDLHGQTVIVVGLGAIGTRIASFCQVLGMQVIGVRRTPKGAGDTLGEIHPPAKLLELVPRCQWLVLACPYNSETHHLVKAEMLAALPGGACVINIARGGIIEEAALIAALRSKHLGGAFLDVFDGEPLPTELPFWDLPNVIVTPHVGAISAGNQRRSVEIFLANIEKWRRGEALENEFNG